MDRMGFRQIRLQGESLLQQLLSSFNVALKPLLLCLLA
jgi:hypothetical protein